MTRQDGRNALMFRVVNSRTNRVMDAYTSLTVLYDEVSLEGVRFRRFIDLPLARPHTPVFALSITCIHHFEPEGLTDQMIKRYQSGEGIEFYVSVKGLDDTFGQTIHADKTYRRSNLRFGGRFQDILSSDPDGSRTLDFANFDNVVEL